MILKPTSAIRPTDAAPFIVVEGINGGGKSTLISGLAQWLAISNISHRCTREPGGTPVGQKLRKILLESEEPLCHESELFLFLADRAQHVQTLIRPTLNAGTTIVCDRFIYSTIAFQGYGRGLDRSRLLDLNRIATSDLRPDLVILLDLPVEEALRRARARGGGESAERDGFELEEIAFHQRVREGFLALADELPEPFLVLDANQSTETLLGEAQAVVNRLFS